MISKLTILALVFSSNNLTLLPAKPPQRPIEIGISIALTQPEILKPLAFKLPEEIKPLEMIGPSVQGAGNSNNTYDWGNCTWYVASNKAIPEDWGNAATWLPRATAEGYKTGLEPKVGAVVWFPPGYSLGHVAIVKSVNTDGTVIISEMNAVGLGVASERLINATEAEYIY